MRDSLDPTLSSDPARAISIQNMYPLELNKPSTFIGRPGFDQAGSQLGATDKRTGQLVTQFTKLDGTEYTVAIVGGQGIYTYNWSTESWSQVVTVANLTTASITLSETARVYAVTFNDKLIISDGTNTPFSWTGASGAGGLASLTNAPVFYGQPTVYYAKVFAIKNSERNVIVWSEENDETVGYETAPYNNTWQLGQTDQEALYAIRGSNEALYYLRARSAGSIRGAVTPEFTADGTHEGVSPTTGTTSPDGAELVGEDERLFFIDADAQPHYVYGRVHEAYNDIREVIRGLDRSKLSSAITRYDPRTGLVLFGVVETGQTHPSALIAFNPILNVPVAVWRGFTFTALGVVKNGTGAPTLMHLSSDGYAYDHGTITGDLWDDELNAGTTAIAHVVETCHLGTDLRYEKRFLRADVLLRAEEDTTSINVRTATPYGAGSAVSASVESSESRWDEFDWDEAPWASGILQRKVAIGLNAIGRWLRLQVSHQVTGEEFGFEAATVSWTPAGDHPSNA